VIEKPKVIVDIDQVNPRREHLNPKKAVHQEDPKDVFWKHKIFWSLLECLVQLFDGDCLLPKM